MKKPFLLALIIIAHLSKAQNYSTPIEDKGVKIHGIESTVNGDIIIVGSTYRNLNTGKDILVVGMDEELNLLFDKIYGDKYQDTGFDINKLYNDNLLISGESWYGFNTIWGRENPIYVEIDSQGNIITAKNFYFFHHDAALTGKNLSDGNILLIGTSRSHQSNIIPSRGDDIFLVKSDLEGNKLWDYFIPAKGNDYAADFIEINNEIVMVAALGGFFNSNQADGRHNHDSQLLVIKLNDSVEIARNEWGLDQNDFPAKILQVPGSDDFFVMGSTQSYGEGSFDIVLIRFDNNLNELWHTTIGGSGYDYGNDMILSGNNNFLYITGTHFEPELQQTQAILVQMDLDGNINWQETLGIDDITNGKAIVAMSNEQIILAGEYGKSMDSLQLFVAKYNEYGNIKPITANAKKITLFPNPIRNGEMLHFSLHSNIKDSIQIEKIEFFNSMGGKIQSVELSPTTHGSILIRFRDVCLVKATLTDSTFTWGKLIMI
jgi:Cu/Ag efflux protein CusF